MLKDGNYKFIGMWMFMFWMICFLKKKEVWFVVNWCFIFYGIREYMLLLGLDCKNLFNKL